MKFREIDSDHLICIDVTSSITHYWNKSKPISSNVGRLNINLLLSGNFTLMKLKRVTEFAIFFGTSDSMHKIGVSLNWVCSTWQYYDF